MSNWGTCYIMMENSGVHSIPQTLSFMSTNVFCAPGVCEDRIYYRVKYKSSDLTYRWRKNLSSLPVCLPSSD